MKMATLALAASALIGLASFSAPASAQHGYGHGAVKHSGAARHHHVRRPVCTVRLMPSRDRHGHRVMKRVRVCR
jgi:hypothetical protein